MRSWSDPPPASTRAVSVRDDVRLGGDELERRAGAEDDSLVRARVFVGELLELADLDERDRRILRLVLADLDLAEIGRALGVAAKTVRRRLDRIADAHADFFGR